MAKLKTKFMKLNVFNQYSPDVGIVVEFLKKTQIRVTAHTVDETLQQHPDYPSILSISDSLKKWDIGNAVVKVESKKLSELESVFPCIAHTVRDSFVIIDAVNKEQVFYTNSKGKTLSTPFDDFLESWDGILLLAERNTNSGEKNYSQNLRKEWMKIFFSWSLLLFPFLLSICAIANNSLSDCLEYNSYGFSLLILLKSLGIVISVLLLWHEIDRGNPLLQQICSGGKKVNCDAVLSSKASQIFSWLSWSEIGFFYFFGGFLALLFSNSYWIVTILSCINVLALPYTVFSVFYQWRIAKQWCRLCLTVQVLLVVEFLVSLGCGIFDNLLVFRDFTIQLMSNFLIPLIPAFLFPIAIWYAIKPQLLAAQQGKRDFRQLQRIKYNSEIFQALLQTQKQIAVDTDGLGITLGNPQAKTHLIKVCNPYCSPCARAHETIDELLQNTDVKVQIIFTTTNEEKDHRALPAKHLLAIASRNDETVTQKALDDWYGAKEKNYEIFTEQHPVSKDEMVGQIEKIESMKKWCDEVNIEFTPTIFINGYQLPNPYMVEDLKYFLAE